MRCYFMRGSSTANVEFLHGVSDDELIRNSLAVFEKHAQQGYDGLEVWDGKRVCLSLHGGHEDGRETPSQQPG